MDDAAETGRRSPTTQRDAFPLGESELGRFGVFVMLLLGGLLVGLASGCADSSSHSERPDPAQMVDSGSWYSRQRWPHDGKPFESENFVVYSDGASLEARQRLASLAEEVLVEVVDEMGIDPETMFRFPADQDKIDLYAYRYNIPDWGGGARAYYAGIIIWSFDNEAEDQPTALKHFTPGFKHELIHVVELLLKGHDTVDIPVSDPRRMPTWFSEGSAEALTGGTSGGAVQTLDRMDGLIAEYGRINPISWTVDLVGPAYDPEAYFLYYYPMAQLAIEYLLDADGLGRSPADLADVMLDMGDDASFASAFETHIGISESDYETEFFALMDTYLPQSEFPLMAIGLGLLSLLAASLMGGSLVWGFRHWPAGATTTGAIGRPVWSSGARRGFLIEISVFAVIAVGLAALLLFSIAFADLQPYAQRSPGYLTTATYLVSSVGILMWAIRRWANRSRSAYLIPLLVIVAAGITIVVLEVIV